MTISNDVIQRAAEAVHNASLYAGCECETCQQEAMSAVRAALPILRDAIRAELVEEMIAKASDEKWAEIDFDWVDGNFFVHQFLEKYRAECLPESEPQP